MRALLIGASGQLGHALGAAFATRHEVIEAGYRHARPGQRITDLGDPASVTAVLDDTRPDVVLITGAQCNVDRCETETAECERINVGGPRTIAQYARDHDTLVVYYSTDHVFDGTKPARYVETDQIAPLNVYAQSKAAGERSIRELVRHRHLILRTAWLYGPDPQRKNFALRLVDRVRLGESVKVPSDQWGCPTFTGDLALTTLALVDGGHVGLFHVSGPEIIDRVTLARRICRHFGVNDERLAPTPTAELGQVAPRPRRTALDCAKVQAAVDVRCRDVDTGLADLAESDRKG